MKRYQNVALFLLVLAIIAQALDVMVRAQPADDTMAPAPMVRLGDSVPSLTGYAEDGAPTTVSLVNNPDFLTVVYAFHPECAFCDTVGPGWAAHLAASEDAKPTPVRRVAVTADLPGPAAAYAERFKWNIELLSVSGFAETGPEAFLVSRTPWIYVFGPDGVLRFHGHGAELAHVDDAVAEIASRGGSRGLSRPTTVRLPPSAFHRLPVNTRQRTVHQFGHQPSVVDETGKRSTHETEVHLDPDRVSRQSGAPAAHHWSAGHQGAGQS